MRFKEYRYHVTIVKGGKQSDFRYQIYSVKEKRQKKGKKKLRKDEK